MVIASTIGSTGQKTHILANMPDSPNLLNKEDMQEDLKQMADLVTANIIGCTKNILTSEEAAKYMGISLSYLYKLTMRQEIPHSKPMGKMVYFDRQELETWLMSNKIATGQQINQQAQAYCLKSGGIRK